MSNNFGFGPGNPGNPDDPKDPNDPNSNENGCNSGPENINSNQPLR